MNDQPTTDPLADHVVGIQALRDQLAAELEKTDNATTNCMSLSKLLYEAKQQLAAAQQAAFKEGIRSGELETQLAAERADRISWQELYEKTKDQLEKVSNLNKK